VAGHHDLTVGQVGHPGGIEENRAGVCRSRRLAGIGVAQATDVLLDQREAGGVREIGTSGQNQARGQAVESVRHEGYSLVEL